MTTQLGQSIARIFTTRGTVAGAGFLVAEKCVLTCAHIVAQTLDDAQETEDMPTGEVRLDFPLVAPGTIHKARVVFWRPVPSSISTVSEGSEDIAALKLESDPPEGVRPASLVTPGDLWGHSFQAFGFPSGHDNGVWASGVLRAGLSGGWVQIEDVKETGRSVVQGFSGTPVLDEAAGGVVGMVVVSERLSAVRAAFIIPTALLIKSWPQLGEKSRARVFISYKRNSDPDEEVAKQVYQALGRHHDVFIDQTMLVGTRWAERIEAELKQSDFVITFLSSHSVLSEMVQGEIEMAHRLSKEQEGRPAILPVRLAYREPFNYPLSAYLNQINWAYWNVAADTDHLIKELLLAISGKELTINDAESKADLIQAREPQFLPQPLPQAQPLSFEMPEGTMERDSMFYIERRTDPVAHAAIARQGVTITIKGPRQMGKSSLLNRTIAAATEAGKRVVFLDFQLVDKASLTNADLFFRQFCSWLTDELGLDDRVEEFWKTPLGNSQRCTRYVSRYVLKQVDGPLVLAMDEVESIFDTEFRSDFFSMLRSWHNNRATVPAWKQLDLALVTSTEPYQLIDNLNQSPFNVGEVIELADFSPAQVADLNRRHGSPLTSEAEGHLMALLDGHPYLVRRALYLIASKRTSVRDLLADATNDRGPFGDHLRYHLFRMHDKQDLVNGLRRVISNNTCEDEHIFFRLRGAGLVRREGRTVVPRCQLYADYFKEHLHE